MIHKPNMALLIGIGINVNQEQETAAAGGKAWQGRQVVARSVPFLEVKIKCLTIGLFVGKPMTVLLPYLTSVNYIL
jgi:hypothetical protein